MAPNPLVLLVDDETALLDVLERYLLDDGFAVVRAGDGPNAVRLFRERSPDLVVLDITLPGFSGIEVLRQMRAERNVPVIILTARVSEVDRVVGLELGADDYVGKPFSPREVVARVKSVLRRTPRDDVPEPSRERCVGEIALDPLAHEVHVAGKSVPLTPTQFKLLDILSLHVGQTLTRQQLLQRVAGESDIYDRTLDRHIANLRARIEVNPALPRYVLTVFGVGYKMVVPQ